MDESDAEGEGSESEKERFDHLGEIKEVGKETSSGVGGGSEDTPLKEKDIDDNESPGLPEQPSIDQTQLFLAPKRTEALSEEGSEPIDDELMRVHNH